MSTGPPTIMKSEVIVRPIEGRSPDERASYAERHSHSSQQAAKPMRTTTNLVVALLASPKPLREPVDDHINRVGSHHHRWRELRIVTREAVRSLNEEMVDVR